jgi:hypothetical protein
MRMRAKTNPDAVALFWDLARSHLVLRASLILQMVEVRPAATVAVS